MTQRRFHCTPEHFTGTTVTLITHLHRDHRDRRLLKRLDDREEHLVVHRAIAPDLSSIGLTVEPADLWNTQKIGGSRRARKSARELGSRE